MEHFFSPSTGGFYNETIHGPRQIAEPQTEKQIKAKRSPRYVANPNCTIPADAVAVDQAAWTALLSAQGEGKVIGMRAGVPVAVALAPSAEEQLAGIRAKRDRLLVSTDPMVTVPDYPIAGDQKAELLIWRAALRDFPAEIAPLLPLDTVNWPARPSWLGENGEKL